MSATLVAGYEEPILLGQWPGYRRGPAEAVAVSGTHAFVLTHGSGMHILDISRAENPSHAGQYLGNNDYYDIAIEGQHAYLISSSSLEVLDLTNPTSPALLASLPVHGLGITVSGTRVYVSGGISTSYLSPGDGFVMIDVSDPTRPKLLNKFTATVDGIPTLAASGSLVYVAGRHWEDRQPPWRYVLQVIDTANPMDPQRIGSFELNTTATGGYAAWAVVVSGNAAYVAGPDRALSVDTPGWALWAIDTSNPREPKQMAKIRLSNKSGQLNMVALNQYLYVSDNESGLEIIDISSPADPKPLGLGLPNTSGQGVVIVDSHAYLASTVDGLRVVDISDRKNPRRVGRCLTDGSSVAVAVTDDYAYLVEERPFRLKVLDVAQPAQPTLVGEWESTWGDEVNLNRVSIVASRRSVYVAASGFDAAAGTNYSGVLVIDVGDPRRPELVGVWNNPESLGWQICDIKVQADIAYVLSERSLLSPVPDGVALGVFDLRDGTTPRLLGRHSFGGGLWASRSTLALSGSNAYVAATNFYIVDISDPTVPREISRQPLTNGGGWMNLQVMGNYAYVGWIGESCCGGFHVFDIADPVHSFQVTEYTDIAVSSMALWGRYLYAQGYGFLDGGTGVLDLLDPRKPKPAAFTFNLGWGGEAQALEDRLYVSADVEGLLIFGIPPRPAFVGQTTLPDGTLALSWNRPGMGLSLQRSSSLANPHWVDAPGSTATNRLTLPRTESTGFFRLVTP